MALEPIALQAIINECRDGKPRRLLSLGYPDILAKPGMFDHIDEREDSLKVKKWHNWPHRIPDTDQVFASLGLTVEYLDYAQVRGPEIVADLNTYPRANYTYPGVDIILDPGTSEHIFNIAHVFNLIVGWCRKGGMVIHTNPLNMANHGFWCIQPTAYADFYEANGFQIEAAGILSGPVHARKSYVLENTTVRFEAPPNSAIFVVARKLRSVELTYPVQTKYRQNPKLQGAA